ncbi:MAG: glucose 1-dehydrogenase [Deltaproteobacteria bacterium]|nr:glucose 1-dehydrogenase [Deltaproteobacteria bacterium]
MRLKDNVSIVTGAGSGIGRGIALLFGKEGSKVVVADVVPETGEETVKIIRSNGGEAYFVRTDVSKSPEVEGLVKRCIENYGRLNILCNNAGILSDEQGLFTDLKEDYWDRIIDVNLKSVFLCCKYAVPEMIQGGGGSIVNISSIAGLIKSPHLAYAASKGGIIALTRSLSMQLADYNIRANVICPGGVDTPGVSEARQKSKEKNDVIVRQRLIDRIGIPEDIGYAAVYLASGEASYVTGSVFTVDGGSLRG